MRLQKAIFSFLGRWREWDVSRPPLSPREVLVVGVSGGPDSLALLHVLAQGGVHPAANLVAAYLNHQWRREAAAEAQFVYDTAAAWGVACRLGMADVPALAREWGLSLEEAGRRARYHFLAEIARQEGARVVAVAHHADDQAETILMHWLRGAGLGGLRGMLPIGPLPGARELALIRPLLAVRRTDILGYLGEHDLTPLEDSSNTDTSFLRNRLRHELLPRLAEYNPRLVEGWQGNAAVIAADLALLDDLCQQAWPAVLTAQGEGWMELNRAAWLAQPLSLRRRLLRLALGQLRAGLSDMALRPLEQARLVAETGQVGAQSGLPDGFQLMVDYEVLRLTAGAGPPTALPQLPDDPSLTLPVPGRVALANGWVLAAQLLADVNLDWIEANRDPWLAFVAAEGIEELTVRPRRPGERFQPLGLGGQSARVKEVMIDRKIPAALRARWPIVATPDHLLWMVGHHLDERRRVTAGTRQVIQLHARREL